MKNKLSRVRPTRKPDLITLEEIEAYQKGWNDAIDIIFLSVRRFYVRSRGTQNSKKAWNYRVINKYHFRKFKKAEI